MDMTIIKNVKDLYRAKLKKFILEKNGENPLISSSTPKEASARTDLF
jgi:hypothetical protein